MNKSIVYAFAVFTAFRYYQGCLPNPQMLKSFWVRGKRKTLSFILLQCLRKAWLPFLIATVLLVFASILDQGNILYVLFPLTWMMLFPILSYSLLPKLTETMVYLSIVMLQGAAMPISLLLIVGLILTGILIAKVKVSKIQMYHKSKNTENRKISTLLIIPLVGYAILSRVLRMGVLPYELFIIVCSTLYFGFLESTFKESKGVQSIYIQRVSLVGIKKGRICTRCFKDRYRIFTRDFLLVTGLFCFLLSGENKMYIEYGVFLLSIAALMLYYVSVFVNYYVLKRSLVFANTIVRNCLDFIMNACVFQYSTFYLVQKVIQSDIFPSPIKMDDTKTFLLVNACIFIAVIVIATQSIRLKKNIKR